MVAVEEQKADNVLRISKNRNVPFWGRTATNFLQGVSGKEDKKVFDEIVISALGAAIPEAAGVVGMVERNKVGTLVKIETKYAEIDRSKRPQVLATIRRNPDYVPPPKKERPSKVTVPPMPERLTGEKLEKKMKKVIKEGGKRGVEIEGAADMGGLKYFCTKVEEPAGDLDMLVESVKAMNAKCDPSEEERKGGSGAIGKTVLSMADNDNLCIVSYVPEKELDDCDAKEWLQYILQMCGAGSVALREDSTNHYAMVCVQNDGDKGLFAIKMRDYVIQHANAFLRSKGLIPEVDDDDDDEMVFGDDDFP